MLQSWTRDVPAASLPIACVPPGPSVLKSTKDVTISESPAFDPISPSCYCHKPAVRVPATRSGNFPIR
jgi:hypothetical protein